jgi:effector-binding domain-containing protein
MDAQAIYSTISTHAIMVSTIKYEIVKKLDKVEIRRYPKIVIAKVDGYEDQSFDLLFGFISGKNKQKTKVKMTAPVVSQRIEMTAPVLSDIDSMAFVMPEEYQLETTPEPLDDRVKIAEVPSRLVAALRFSGRWDKSHFDAEAKELLEDLAKAGIKTKGNVFIMLYNAPFTPGFMRRNEVAIAVELEK